MSDRMSKIIAWAVSSIAVCSAGAWAAEGPNYCSFAKRYLEEGSSVTCHGDLAYCLRLNNYGCVKQRVPAMPGTVGQDPKRHAIFSDPAWSIAMMIDRFRIYGTGGKVSAYQIMKNYSPWCDTQGSDPIKNGYGRSCTDKPHPPAGFKGPFCKELAVGAPRPVGYCDTCNCPDEVAKDLLKGTGKDINDPLDLLSADVEPVLRTIIRRLVFQETSKHPNKLVLDDGIAKFRQLPH